MRCNRIFAFIIAIVLLAPAAAAASSMTLSLAPGEAPVDAPLDWNREAMNTQLAIVPDGMTHGFGAGGTSTLRCQITATGSVGHCTVLGETPEGSGFGRAALTVTPHMFFTPPMRNGKAVEVVVDITTTWTRPQGQQVGTLINRTKPLGDRMTFSHVLWTASPSIADIEAAFPAKARQDKVGGTAELNCVFGAGGRITGCSSKQETPQGYGFSNAALTLASKFMAPPTRADGKSAEGDFVNVTVQFPAELATGGDKFVTQAEWIGAPTNEMFAQSFPAAARAAGVSTSRVVVSCIVGPTGALGDCGVKEETPANMGFGQAALALAPKFVMKQWSDAGVAMVGRRINLPISNKMDVKQAAAPAAAPKTSAGAGTSSQQ